MARTRKLEPKAREVIMQKIYESGEMETEEIMDLIDPHFLFDKDAARKRELRRTAQQMMSQVRDEKGVRIVFACKVDGIRKYVNIDESRNVKALRSVEGQLADKRNGLEVSCAKASKRRMEVEGQLSFNLEEMEGGNKV